MATDADKELIADGTPVRVKHSGFDRAWVAEYRGALGPKGEHVYRILVSKKPRIYSMALESQLEIIDDSEE